MSWDPWTLKVEVLELFAEHLPKANLAFGFCFVDPAKNAEASREWKRLHPLRAKQHGEKWRRSRGISDRRGAPSKPFCDQHGTRYHSLRECMRLTGLHYTTVRDVLKGRLERAKGFTFRYCEA